MKIRIGDYVIRDWRGEDCVSLAKYGNNRNIWRNLRDAFPHPYDVPDAKEFISRATKMNPKTYFAIASEIEAIGSVGFTLGVDVHRPSSCIKKHKDRRGSA